MYKGSAAGCPSAWDIILIPVNAPMQLHLTTLTLHPLDLFLSIKEHKRILLPAGTLWVSNHQGHTKISNIHNCICKILKLHAKYTAKA